MLNSFLAMHTSLPVLIYLLLADATETTIVMGTEKLHPSSHDSTRLGGGEPSDSTKATTRGFWLTIEVVSVEFRKGCLTTALCHEPKFKLINTMTLNGEEFVMSWPANGDTTLKETARPFTTHWTNGGDPEDVAMACQVAGTDPSFGFQRVCDETPSRRVFNDASIRQALMNKMRTKRESTFDNDDRVFVELKGKCFNVTLAARKFLKRCPWCPDFEIVVGGAGGQTSFSPDDPLNSPLFSSSQPLFVYNCIILALSGAVVIAFASLACTLLIHYRHRRRAAKGAMVGKSPAKQKHFNLVVGVNGEHYTTNGKPGSGPKRLLKYAPLPSERLPPEQQQRTCPRTVATPTCTTARRPPPPFSPPTAYRASKGSRGDLVLALDGDARAMDAGPLTEQRWDFENSGEHVKPDGSADKISSIVCPSIFAYSKYEEPWEAIAKYRPLAHYWMSSSPSDQPPPPPPSFPPFPSFPSDNEPHYHQCPMVLPNGLNDTSPPTTNHYDTSGNSSMAYSSTKSCPAAANANVAIRRPAMGSQPNVPMTRRDELFSPPLAGGGGVIMRNKHDDSGLESV